MATHKYTIEHIEKRTYLKGRFKGKFSGSIDALKSDAKTEQYYDLVITEGEIFTTQDAIKMWPNETGFSEFENSSTLKLKPPGELKVSLRYLDNTERYFKISMNELKLVNCLLSKQVYTKNEVIGCIEGDVSGYVLHQESIINEIKSITSHPSETPAVPSVSEAKKIIATSAKKKYSRLTPALVLRGSLGLLILLVAILQLLRSGIHWLPLTLCFISFCMLLPFVLHSLFSSVFKHALSNRWKRILYVLLPLILLVVLGIYYASYLLKKEAMAAGEFLKQKKEKEIAQQKRLASLHYYLGESKKLYEADSIQASLTMLQKAQGFAEIEDLSKINAQANTIDSSIAKRFLSKKNYEQALNFFNKLIQREANQAIYLYDRALCYIKTGNRKAAAADLKMAITQGNKVAEKLYNKINPKKKRLIGYITRCCDGTESNAKGRGACSHHGGVCNWNEPVYETYREFD